MVSLFILKYEFQLRQPGIRKSIAFVKLDAIIRGMEKKFLQLTNDLKNDRTDAIKTVNTALAIKMLGKKGKVYKRIKGALASDEAVKVRYDAIVAIIKMKDGES